MAKREEKEIAIAKTRGNKARTGGPSPRMTHGTRVAFNITCEVCGKDDSLPFVPKNVDRMLCRNCATEQLGEGWDKGRIEKPMETAYTCANCGTDGTVPFVPEDPDEPMLCKRCLRGEHQPVKGRVDGGVVLDRKAGLKKRKG